MKERIKLLRKTLGLMQSEFGEKKLAQQETLSRLTSAVLQ